MLLTVNIHRLLYMYIYVIEVIEMEYQPCINYTGPTIKLVYRCASLKIKA
jgi:hypothetical protein